MSYTHWKDTSDTKWKDTSDTRWEGRLLVVQDASHAHNVGSLSIVVNLAVANASHSHSTDGSIVVELVPNDVSHGHNAKNVNIIQDHRLTANDTSHGHTAESKALTQDHHLSVNDTVQTQSSDNVVLTQDHHLAVVDASHGHNVESLSIVVALVVADTTHTHGVDSPALIQDHHLTVADASHTHSADAVILQPVLNINGTTHSQTVENLLLTQDHQLNLNDSGHTQSADVVDIETYRTYDIDEIQKDLVRAVKNIIQDTTFSYDDILDLLNEAQEAIAGGILLSFPDGTQVFSAPLENLETSGTVTAGTTNPYVSLPSDYQRDLYYAFNEDTDTLCILLDGFGDMLKRHPKLDLSDDVSVVAKRGSRLYFQGSPDDSQTITLKYFREPYEMAEFVSSQVSFVDSTLSDAGDGLSVFYAGQTIDIVGASENRGVYTVATVASDGSYLTVDETFITKSADDEITVRSRPDGIPEYLDEDLLVNYAVAKYFQRHTVHNVLSVDFAREYRKKFYDAVLDMDVAQYREYEPLRLRA